MTDYDLIEQLIKKYRKAYLRCDFHINKSVDTKLTIVFCGNEKYADYDHWDPYTVTPQPWDEKCKKIRELAKQHDRAGNMCDLILFGGFVQFTDDEQALLRRLGLSTKEIRPQFTF